MWLLLLMHFLVHGWLFVMLLTILIAGLISEGLAWLRRMIRETATAI